MSGWRQESGKNHFSRQSVTVNGDAYSIPALHFQETIAHQRFPSLIPDRRTIPAANLTQQAISPAIHQRFSDIPAYFLPEHGGSQIQPQSWMGREANPYSHVEHSTNSNSNIYGRIEFENPGPSRVGPSWVRNNCTPEIS
ncbi:hypothetical protein L1987_76456 [Smallanthus sonchifolius]|uniref:Uncharacterized protein n=1 Tax=Smallanthus sonchifolius TaxID=185202 RepID=A0ACB8Z6V1_9ASTR|nr:hypothetical protein L1987_76456 [Smallanthus sonchifolius]